jgi:SAM-dependent methyltransferase
MQMGLHLTKPVGERLKGAFLPISVAVDILQNILMGLRPLARLAQRYHSTGLNADTEMVRRVFGLYSRFVSVKGKDILEIGPGHTLEVLERARAEGARSCTAVDVIDYRPPGHATLQPVTCIVYDGRELPLEAEQFDVVWSYTAFEHLRYPEITVHECFRVLRHGGILVSLIDLGDHSFYGKTEPCPERIFDCLRYPEWLWNLMRWNRSSYVNRLRQSDWIRLLEKTGFVFRAKEATVNEDTIRLLPHLGHLQQYDYEDAVTSVMTVCFEKP